MDSRRHDSKKSTSPSRPSTRSAPEDVLTPPSSRKGTQLYDSPVSSPSLRKQSLHRSLETAFDQANYNSRAAEPNERFGSLLLQEEEEHARQSQSQTHASSGRRTTSQPRAPFHTSQQTPGPQSATISPDFSDRIISLKKAGLSDALIMSMMEKKGHEYGTTSAKDKARVILGNIYKNSVDVPFMASHKYGDTEASGSHVRVQKGDVPAEWASDFMRRDLSDDLPAPPMSFTENVGAHIYEDFR